MTTTSCTLQDSLPGQIPTGPQPRELVPLSQFPPCWKSPKTGPLTRTLAFLAFRGTHSPCTLLVFFFSCLPLLVRGVPVRGFLHLFSFLLPSLFGQKTRAIAFCSARVSGGIPEGQRSLVDPLFVALAPEDYMSEFGQQMIDSTVLFSESVKTPTVKAGERFLEEVESLDEHCSCRNA